ncbi:hypothetical protein [Crossiella cryophila]|uniref:Uncharacterized protein n=1 Tax=Crossiella cryophila TaxID=43355 RepID=A0A7W7C9U3_9PSEU|nr:hypothetical protein [Crossiella cryophila]MBB4677215.1 hypothetical protein [Crossiella cryophila]
MANRAAFDERLPEDKLRQLYVEERVGAQAIAQQVGCSVRMVYLRLAELKVPLHHPRSPRFKGVQRIAAVAHCHRLRHDQGYSVAEVAQLVRRQDRTVRSFLAVDLSSWSEDEIAEALRQYPDPFFTAGPGPEEQQAWLRVAELEHGPVNQFPLPAKETP